MPAIAVEWCGILAEVAMLRNRSICSGVLMALALVVALALGIRFSFLVTDRIAPGVRLAGVEVGGLTHDEAAARLKDWSRQRLSGRLDLAVAGRRWMGKLRDLGVVTDVRAMARAAHSVGRCGSVLTRIAEGLGFSRNARNLPGCYRCDRERLGRILAKIRTAVAVPARNARISFSDGARRIVPEVPGTTIDVAQSLGLISSAVAGEQSNVVLPIVPDRPKVSSSDLEQVDSLLASYTTWFPAWRRDRTHNIRLAVAALDGTLVKPGEVFSYNNTVGPRQKASGFRDALIFVKGKIIPGTGGGVCQVSSTVYNAALLSNLDIIARSHHSMRVQYVPMGRDATVAYGLLDLRFRNTVSAPIYIMARAGRSRVTISIYGASRDKRDVRIVTTRPKRIRKEGGDSPVEVAVYRVVSQGGVEVSRHRMSSDRYNPAPPPEAAPKPKPGRLASRASTSKGAPEHALTYQRSRP